MPVIENVVAPNRADNYLDYNVAHEYERFDGVLVLPTADSSPVVIRVHEPYRIKRTAYSGKGRGEPTVMPVPADSDTVLSHTHTIPMPVPFQSGEGNGFIYVCAGSFSVLETGSAGLLSAAEYQCPTTPFRLEPMSSEARAAGYGFFPGELVSQTPREFDPSQPNTVWPQSLTITSSCFSSQLA